MSGRAARGTRPGRGGRARGRRFVPGGPGRPGTPGPDRRVRSSWDVSSRASEKIALSSGLIAAMGHSGFEPTFLSAPSSPKLRQDSIKQSLGTAGRSHYSQRRSSVMVAWPLSRTAPPSLLQVPCATLRLRPCCPSSRKAAPAASECLSARPCLGPESSVTVSSADRIQPAGAARPQRASSGPKEQCQASTGC